MKSQLTQRSKLLYIEPEDARRVVQWLDYHVGTRMDIAIALHVTPAAVCTWQRRGLTRVRWDLLRCLYPEMPKDLGLDDK